MIDMYAYCSKIEKCSRLSRIYYPYNIIFQESIFIHFLLRDKMYWFYRRVPLTLFSSSPYYKKTKMLPLTALRLVPDWQTDGWTGRQTNTQTLFLCVSSLLIWKDCKVFRNCTQKIISSLLCMEWSFLFLNVFVKTEQFFF